MLSVLVLSCIALNCNLKFLQFKGEVVIVSYSMLFSYIARYIAIYSWVYIVRGHRSHPGHQVGQ